MLNYISIVTLLVSFIVMAIVMLKNKLYEDLRFKKKNLFYNIIPLAIFIITISANLFSTTTIILSILNFEKMFAYLILWAFLIATISFSILLNFFCIITNLAENHKTLTKVLIFMNVSNILAILILL